MNKSNIKKRRLGTSSIIVAYRRSRATDTILAIILAAVAGAANAGGFFALGQYTSHMTGYVSLVADNIAILEFMPAFVGILAISSFVAGSAFSALLINWARTRSIGRQQYAWPLAVQGIFFFCFSWGGIFGTEAGRLFSLACLCFIMGMQNATITKISRARIRTTHATGMITDIGIEIGRVIFTIVWRGTGVQPDYAKLMLLGRLVFAFLGGGILGAVGYAKFGFPFSSVLSVILLAISVPSIVTARQKSG